MSVLQALYKPFVRLVTPPKQRSGKLGTFSGVFIPSILQMIGVILFMRLGWILGHVGLPSMIALITLASSLILITALSMTSVATNMRIGGGGSYFIISRSLGMEFGSAIGILLTVSQIVSIALNVSGFSLSIQTVFFPGASLPIIEACVLCFLTGISYLSTNIAVKTQFIIFSLIAISLGSIFLGGVNEAPIEIGASTLPVMSLAVAFSMFFPATVGIEAGMAMSGDLKTPGRSLSIGTIASIITGFCLYIGMSVFLWSTIPRQLLVEEPLILSKMAKLGAFVVLGTWGATLSSALGSVLGAPRTMQALGEDGILPRFLSKGYGPTNQPRVATMVTFAVALFVLLVSSINRLIPILTMVSLVTYSLINFVAFFESKMQNPSWRPTFQTPWYLSLVGFIACFLVMLTINPLASFVVFGAVIVLVIWFSKKKMQGNWEDIRYSVLTSIVRLVIAALEKIDKSAKSWRPHILALVDNELEEKNLIHLAHTLDRSKGFLTYGTTIPVGEDRSHELKQTKQTLKKYFSEQGIPCFVNIHPFDDPFLGILSMIKSYGIGPLRPNTVLLRHHLEHSCPENLSNFLLSAFHMGKNVVILKDRSLDELRLFSKSVPHKKIDIWWGGKYYRNFEFSLVLAYILQQSSVWNRADVHIKTIVANEVDKGLFHKVFKQYATILRMKGVSYSAYIGDVDKEIYPSMRHYSKESNFVLIGLRPPEDKEPYREYAKYYMDVIESTKDIPNAAYILSGEDIDFEKVFH